MNSACVPFPAPGGPTRTSLMWSPPSSTGRRVTAVRVGVASRHVPAVPSLSIHDAADLAPTGPNPDPFALARLDRSLETLAEGVVATIARTLRSCAASADFRSA